MLDIFPHLPIRLIAFGQVLLIEAPISTLLAQSNQLLLYLPAFILVILTLAASPQCEHRAHALPYGSRALDCGLPLVAPLVEVALVAPAEVVH